MDMYGWASAWLAVCAALGSRGEVRRAGWLDRLVLHHKNHFIEEVRLLAPIDIRASIEKAPVGYVDSPAWDYASVTRLLALIGASETARPVRSALRRALLGNETAPPSRRFMSRQKSYKFFPSLAQMHSSNLYYDVDTDADYASEEEGARGEPPPTAVVLVRNPVEARLPSARISVHLLKEILNARAVAARQMPTTKTTSGWIWTTKSVPDPSKTSAPTATTEPEPAANHTEPTTASNDTSGLATETPPSTGPTTPPTSNDTTTPPPSNDTTTPPPSNDTTTPPPSTG